VTAIKLSERETAALLALAHLCQPATGAELAGQMLAVGRETSDTAAHQAANALSRARLGLAVKSFDGPVRYEITARGREMAARIGGAR
jgi:hypothetical protein